MTSVIIRGDTTNKGKIEYLDILLLDLYVVGILKDSGNTKKYDFYRDGKINSRDAALMHAYMIGFIFTNPIDLGD